MSSTAQTTTWTSISTPLIFMPTGAITVPIDRHPHDPRAWCRLHNVKVTRAGYATLYKAVDQRLRSGHLVQYAPGTTVTAHDWLDDYRCGGGLHFSPSPKAAGYYHYRSKVRYLAVRVKVDDLRPIRYSAVETPKCKAPKCRVLYEVDIDGNKIENGEGV